MLKRIATVDAANGPILFLKSDRLEGGSWLVFAAALGLQHHEIGDLLAEIGSTGTPVLFIDGIDRVRPDQRGIIKNILRAIEENDHLANWKVLASSRDQGLEAYRAWFPASFYRGSFIGDVSIGAGQGHALDNIIVELDETGSRRRLGLQAKRRIQVSAAAPAAMAFQRLALR